MTLCLCAAFSVSGRKRFNLLIAQLHHLFFILTERLSRFSQPQSHSFHLLGLKKRTDWEHWQLSYFSGFFSLCSFCWCCTAESYCLLIDHWAPGYICAACYRPYRQCMWHCILYIRRSVFHYNHRTFYFLQITSH